MEPSEKLKAAILLSEAKQETALKFRELLQQTEDLIHAAANSEKCGFCKRYHGCQTCPAQDVCREMERNFIDFVQVALDYLQNDLLPWLEEPEVPNEKDVKK